VSALATVIAAASTERHRKDGQSDGTRAHVSNELSHAFLLGA
jgi:hypothetical protein